MTPPETPDRRSTEPETSAERNASVISVSDGANSAGEKADNAAEQESPGDNDQQPTNGEAQHEARETEESGESQEEAPQGTPPPWQRMTNETDQETSAPSGDVGQDNQESAEKTRPRLPSDAAADQAPTGPPRHEGPGEDTVTVRRPVVTGSAAPGVFHQQTVTFANPAPGRQPAQGAPADGPQRTAVHLGTQQQAAGGNQRPIGVAPPSALRRPGRGPRRASLQIKRVDPWSVLKLSLVLGVALFFVWLVAVGVLYTVLEGMGVWDKLNGTYNELLQGGIDAGSSEQLVSAGRVFGVAAIIGAVNIVLFSALATIGAFVYNVSADLAGGLEVTLAERE